MSKEQVFDRSKYILGIDTYDKKETLEEIEIISKQMEIDQAEKLKDFDTWKEWKNKSN